MWKVGDIVGTKTITGSAMISLIRDDGICVLVDASGAATYPLNLLIPTPKILNRWRKEKLERICSK